MATPTASERHGDRYLTTFSLAYVQDEANFVARAASSVIPVNKASDKFVQYNRGDFWRDEATPRPLGGRPRQVEFRTTSDSYIAEEYALEHTIDDRQRANADEPLRLEESGIRMLTEKHMIRRDRVWATNFFKTGVWPVDQTGVSAAPGANQFIQFNETASDPILVLDEQKDEITKLTGKRPNMMVIGPAVVRRLRTPAALQEVIK